jgi:rhomboid protease GluP
MAIGFTPKYVTSFPLGNLTPQQFISLAIHTVHALRWTLVYVSHTGLVAYTDRTRIFPNGELRINLSDTHATITCLSTGTSFADFGRNRKFVQRFTTKLAEISPLFVNEVLELHYEDMRPYLDMQETDLMQHHLPEKPREVTQNILSFFLPSKGHVVTPLLVNLNILVFMLMVISGVSISDPDTASLIRWGANFKPLTLGAEPWRLLSSVFVHAGFVHLGMNMGALLFIGMVLEPIMGKTRLLAAYLLTGLAASLTSLAWHAISVSVGASGAIFGLYGVFIALLTTNMIERNLRRFLLLSIVTFVGYNLANGMTEGIDNAAHIGGLVSGLLMGYAMIPSLRQPKATGRKWATVALLTLLTGTSAFALYRNLPDTATQYENSMRTIAAREQKATEVLVMPSDTPRDSLLQRFNQDGIANWEANIRTIDSLKTLRLPVSVTERNAQLRTYYDLRIKSYQLYIKSISENTHRYDMEISDYDRQMQAVMRDTANN